MTEVLLRAATGELEKSKKFILHGFREYALSNNANLILREFLVADFLILLIALPAFHRRWRYVFGQFVHIVDAFRVLEYAEPERLQNIIVDIFYMVLEDARMLPPHVLSQL